MEDLVARLGHVRHFRDLPQTAIRAIVTAGQIKRFAAGSVIFLEGDPCAGMFVLLAGQVHICKAGGRGQQEIMAVMEPVIMFNEVAVLDGGPNPTMAIAARDCVTWCIACDAFHGLVRSFPEVGLSLLPVLAARNRVLISRYEDLASRTVVARTAKLLISLSRHGNTPIDRRQHTVDQLSAHIGSVREPVSRSLKTLRDEGLIEYTRSAITICDIQGLARRAHVDLLS